jgi:hypothetical protein
MKLRYGMAVSALCVVLASCGGGSGGVASTPAPAPAPAPSPTPAPAPTNTTVTDLKYSQSFANDATALSGTWDTTTGTGIDGSTGKTSLTISFDAKTGGYTVETGGRSLTVGAADVASDDAYETRYSQSDTTGTNYLTLVKQPYSGGPQTQYVAMGYWQHNTLDGSNQTTDFATFTYGLPTAAGAVPGTGTAAYGIDIFGLLTAPGEEPTSMQGRGQFSVDFSRGLFSADGTFDQLGLVTGSQTTGGGLELHAGGELGSGGTFGGNAWVGSTLGHGGGSIAGRFFGPNGEEVGASFEASDKASGFAAVGSFVGQGDASLTPVNQTLTGLTHEQLFYTRYGQYAVGSLKWINSETFDFGGYSSDMGGGRFTVADKVASADPNFTSYKKHITDGYGEQDVALQLYKPGTANTELALTYASFGHWAGTRAGQTQDSFFTYGFTTGQYFLAARTGTAHYEGVAYGAGLNSDATASFDVTGTSDFDVDFSSETFVGGLTLAGLERGSGRSVTFGDFDVDGPFSAAGAILTGDVRKSGASLGAFYAQFFGPDGQELAGTFEFNAPAAVDGKDVFLKGAVAAARK